MEDIQNVFLPRMAKYTHAKNGWGLWKVSTIDTNEFIGWILVRPMEFFTDAPKFDDIELGWRFLKKSWGKGYASEAAVAIKSALVLNKNTQSSINSFSAIAIKENYGSIAVMKKMGMVFIKQYLHKDTLGDMEVVLYRLEVS